MSDMKIGHVLRKQMIDIVDEEWLKDTLSDDEIVVPKEEFMLEDLHDEETLFDSLGRKREDKWTDLGLEEFTESSSARSAILASNTSTSAQPQASSTGGAPATGPSTQSP